VVRNLHLTSQAECFLKVTTELIHAEKAIQERLNLENPLEQNKQDIIQNLLNQTTLFWEEQLRLDQITILL
jgi:hypothetical protein